MKKILIFMLVLGMASAANAALTGFSLMVAPDTLARVPEQGEYYDPVDTQLYLNPDETLWVGIYNPTDGSAAATQKGIAYLGLVTGPAASWTGSWVQYVPPLVPDCPDNKYFGDAVDWYGDGSLYVDLWELTLTDGKPDTFNMQGVLDAKELQCDEAFLDAIVYLWDGSNGALLDTIVIHQIPEPMTVLLLGFGGLFLRRRKK